MPKIGFAQTSILNIFWGTQSQIPTGPPIRLNSHVPPTLRHPQFGKQLCCCPWNLKYLCSYAVKSQS